MDPDHCAVVYFPGGQQADFHAERIGGRGKQ